MKKIKLIFAVMIGLLLVACNSNEPTTDPESTEVEKGKLKETEVARFIPYKEGGVYKFSKGGGIVIVTYTANEVATTRTDSTLTVTAKLKGSDYDGGDYYNLDLSVVCTNKKQIDASFKYLFKYDETHYNTQEGSYHYEDTENTGELPASLTLTNDKNIIVAELEYRKGLIYYHDEVNDVFKSLSNDIVY